MLQRWGFDFRLKGIGRDGRKASINIPEIMRDKGLQDHVYLQILV